MRTYKLLTHDYRPPIQGGAPLWDGVTLPHELPRVVLDTTDAECAPGWYSVDRIEDAIPIVGLWPDGWPVCAVEVERTGRVHTPSGGKARSEGLTIAGRATVAEMHDAVGRWTATWAGKLAAEMTVEQMAWWEALGRPTRDNAGVEAGLRAALSTRGLSWGIQRYDSAWDAMDAWDTKDAWAARDARDAWAARDARDAWDTRDTRDAWDARDAWDTWDARDAWAARDAWDTRDARDVWAARAARAAMDALSVYYAARRGWVTHAPSLLTVGLRDAYRCGLDIAVPTGPDTLGWAMED